MAIFIAIKNAYIKKERDVENTAKETAAKLKTKKPAARKLRKK